VVDGLAPASFKLTTATDDLTGSANADTIEGVLSDALSEGTLQVSDKIDGGEGTDTLKVDLQKSWTGFTTGSMANVEKVELTSKTSATVDYSAKGSTGVTSYNVDSTTGSVTLSELDVLADLAVEGPTAASTFTVGYKAVSTVATGTQTDIQNITVKNVGTVDSDGKVSTANSKLMDIDIDYVETLAITTAGDANTFNFDLSSDVTKATVTGAGTTEIQDVASGLTSFDASGATGKVVADLTSAATNKLATVKSGAGDDNVLVSMDDLTTSATVSAGEGTDKLTVTAATDTVQLAVSGVETLEYNDVTAVNAHIFSGTNVSGLEKILFSDVGALAGNAQFVNMGSGDITVAAAGAITSSTISADNSGVTTVNLDAASTQTAQGDFQTSLTFDNASALTVNVGDLMKYSTGTITYGGTGAATVNVATEEKLAIETTEFAGTLTANTASSLTVAAEGQLNSATFNANKATTGSISVGSVENSTITTLSAAKMTSLTVDADKGLDVTTATLTDLQTLTADTEGFFDLNANALGEISTLTLTGTNDNSQFTVGNLGASTQTYAINLTADGLKAGLTTAAIDAGTAKAIIDVTDVTGTVTFVNVDAEGGIDINAKDTAKAISTGTLISKNATATVAGDITVTATDIQSTLTTGTIDAAEKGDVTLTATNAAGLVSTGAITGDNVTIDVGSALGDGEKAIALNFVSNGVDGTDEVTAKSSFTYTASGLYNNGFDIGTSANSTDFVTTINGGAKNETFRIDGNTKQSSITLKGDAGAGTNIVAIVLADTATATTDVTVDVSAFTGSDKTTTTTDTNITAEATNNITFKGSAMNDTVTIGGGAMSSSKTISITDSTTTDTDTLDFTDDGGAIALTKLSLSGIEKITVDDSNDNGVSINASAISGETIDFVGDAADDVITLTGTTDADVIDLSNATTSGNQVNFTITGSALNDSIVLSDAGVSAETLTFVDDNGKDTITSFETGTDKLDFSGITGVTGVTGTADNNIIAAAAANSVAWANDNTNMILTTGAASDITTAGTETISDFTNATQVAAYLEELINFNNTADTTEVGIFVIADENSGGSSYIWLANDDGDGDNTDLTASDLTLIGVVSSVNVVEGDIV
jgi:hypothetical protein